MSPSSAGISRLVTANCGRELNISKKAEQPVGREKVLEKRNKKKEIRWTKESIRLDWTLMKHDFYTRAQAHQWPQCSHSQWSDSRKKNSARYNGAQTCA